MPLSQLSARVPVAAPTRAGGQGLPGGAAQAHGGEAAGGGQLLRLCTGWAH